MCGTDVFEADVSQLDKDRSLLRTIVEKGEYLVAVSTQARVINGKRYCLSDSVARIQTVAVARREPCLSMRLP